MSKLHPRTHETLLSAWRENRLAAVHIDMQRRFSPTEALCEAVKKLSTSLRALDVENIWVAYAYRNMKMQNARADVGHIAGECETGHNILDGIGADEKDPLIVKNHDSAFYLPSWPLHNHLQAKGKDTLLITGLHHDYCVGETIQDGILSNRYNIVAVGDCIDIPDQTNAGYHYYARWMAHNCQKREQRRGVYNLPREQIDEQYQNRFHIATSALIIDALTP